MKKIKNQSKKRFVPLLASMMLLAGPIMLVTSCDNGDITRYPASLPDNEQNRILFNFIGVNYDIDAKSQFSAAYSEGMDIIKKNVEGIIAQQEFYNFFKKLGFQNTKDKTTGQDKFTEIYNKIKDNIGLNLLANAYFSALNSNQNFDNTVYKSHLIFQTNSWHQEGTTKFNYSANDFYAKNDPNTLFDPNNTTDGLYSNMSDQDYNTFTQKLITVAKYADENYNKDISGLTNNSGNWKDTVGENLTPPAFSSDLNTYQKQLYRFKWLLRFRYQQYYNSTILPELNETMFTMSNILNSIFKITNDSAGKPKIEINIGKYANQLQSWSGTWKSNFRYVWEYTTNNDNAMNIDENWSTKPLPDLMQSSTSNGLNSNFFQTLSSNDPTVVNGVDPVFGSQGFIVDPSSKPYNSQIAEKNYGQWVTNPNGGVHFWNANNKGTFSYSLPIYWIDDILNLNFNYLDNNSATSANALGIDTTSQSMQNILNQWNNSNNYSASNSPFSQYLRFNGASSANQQTYEYMQSLKWKIFWQMLLYISDQGDSATNKTVASDNFTTSAKTLYPKYIKKENIFDEEFWNAVSSFYS